MKKIECQLSNEISECIDKLCNEKGYTRAEFNRRAIEWYLDFRLETLVKQDDKIKTYLAKG